MCEQAEGGGGVGGADGLDVDYFLAGGNGVGGGWVADAVEVGFFGVVCVAGGDDVGGEGGMG